MTLSKIRNIAIGLAMATVMAVPALSVASGPRHESRVQKVDRKIEKVRDRGFKKGRREGKKMSRRHHRKMRMHKHMHGGQMRKHMK